MVGGAEPRAACPVEEYQVTLARLERHCEQLTDEDAKGGDSDQEHIARAVAEYFHIEMRAIRRSPMNWKCERVMTDSDIANAWDRLFVLLTDWAMSIPEFCALPHDDQTMLCRRNFTAIGWLHYAYKCYSNGHINLGIPIGNGSYIPYHEEHQAQMDPKGTSTYGVWRKVVDPVVRAMVVMDIDEGEYCLLKALALFQEDEPLSVEGAAIAERQREKIFDAFSAHRKRRFSTHTNGQQIILSNNWIFLYLELLKISNFEAMMRKMIAEEVLSGIRGAPLSPRNCKDG